MHQPSDPYLFPPGVKAGLVTASGEFAVRRICQDLGVEPADFARLTGRTTESVAKMFSSAAVAVRDDRTKKVLRELLQLQGILQAFGLPPKEAKAWMHAPLPAFDGKTPEELVAEGRGQNLVARLIANASGNVGS